MRLTKDDYIYFGAHINIFYFFLDIWLSLAYNTKEL